MSDYIEVVTSIDSRESAQNIAEALVARRLAACVQISGPITSTYWWQGKVEVTEEWTCTAKTRKDLYSAVEQALKAIHSYDVPEITSKEIFEGSASYLSWIHDETQSAGETHDG